MNETLEPGFPKKAAMLMAMSVMMLWKIDGNFCAKWLL